MLHLRTQASPAVAGMMLYGNGYWGVTEANYFVVLGHFLSAAFGARLWEGEYRDVMGWELPFGLTLRRGDIAMLIVLGGGVHQSCGCIYRTLKSKVPPTIFPSQIVVTSEAFVR